MYLLLSIILFYNHVNEAKYVLIYVLYIEINAETGLDAVLEEANDDHKRSEVKSLISKRLPSFQFCLFNSDN